MDFRLHVLETITDNFSDEKKVGRGAYGDVYKAEYNGKEIAVKKLHPLLGFDDSDFKNEFRNLSKVHHENIVRLIGYCYESRMNFVEYKGELITALIKQRILCFDFMQGGSLDSHITDELCDLDWPTCYRIITGTCEGLNHLHSAHDKPIFHMDLKPANILLDENMTAKIADLGLSRIVNSTQAHKTMVASLRGRFGYMPPEYIDELAISKKFDVYSLGAIIIRIMDGRNGHSHFLEMGAEKFIENVIGNWDRRLQGTHPQKKGRLPGTSTSRYSSHKEDILRVKTCVDIALRCVEKDRKKRPSIKDIVQELEELEVEIKKMPLYSEDLVGQLKLGVFSPEEQMDAHQIHLGATEECDKRSIPVPSQKKSVPDTISNFEGDSSMMKKKDVSLFELWDKSSKARKITSTSTPTPLSDEIESNLQLALVQTHDEGPQPERERGSPTLIVEDDEAVDEDDESMPQFEAYHHFINQKDLESPVPLPNRVKLLYKGHLILNVIFGILIGSIAVLRWYTGRAEFGRTAILICLVVSIMLVLVCSRYCFFRNGRGAGLEAYILTGAMVLDDYLALLMINIEYTRIVMIPCMILFLIGTLGWKLRNSVTKDRDGVNKEKQNNKEEILSGGKTDSSDKLELFEFVSYLLQLSLVTWTQYKGQQGCSPVLSDFLLFFCSALGALGGMLASPLAGLNSRVVSEEVLPVLHKTCTVLLFIAVHTMAAEWLLDDMIYVCLPELIVVLVWFTICLGTSLKNKETIGCVQSLSVSSFTSAVVGLVAILAGLILISSNILVPWIIWAFWISSSSSASCQFHVWLLHSWPAGSSESNKLIRLLNVASSVCCSTAAILCFCMMVIDRRILYEAISSFEHKAIAAVVPIILLLTSVIWYARRHPGQSESHIKGITVTAGWKQLCRGYLLHMLNTEKVATPSVSKNEQESDEILELEQPEQESEDAPEKEKPEVYHERLEGRTADKSVPEERPSMREDLELSLENDQSGDDEQSQTELMIGATDIQELPRKAYIMSRELVDLSSAQLLKLADLIHQQEVQKLQELEFKSYADQQKYLNDAKDARDKVYHILETTQKMIMQTESEKDATKKDIAKDVYDYCTIAIETSLKFIRSYNTRLTYLDKLKSHTDDLIKQLQWLNPATKQKEAQSLALEAGMYKKAALENAKKFQHFTPNQFSKWLKENKIMFEDLVQDNMAKLGFTGTFKNLDDIQKLQVYDNIIAEAGQGKSVVAYSFEALGKGGVAFLVFTSAAMVWDIYTAEDKLQAAVRDSVNALTAVVNLRVGDVVTAAVEAGFVALDIEIASAAVTVIGAVAGFGTGALIGMAAGALPDLIFSSGTSKVKITDGLTVCRVAPMPDGLQLARLVKNNYPDL